MNFIPDIVIALIRRAFPTRADRRRLVGTGLVLFVLSALGGIVAALLGHFKIVPGGADNAIPFVAAAGALIVTLNQLVNAFELEKTQVKIDSVEVLAREHPEKSELAWDLARIKLESYLDRNLSQVRSIYWLTLFVMIAGFCLIVYGLQQSFSSTDKLAVSIVASASGVLVSFIGGSFLLIYRSILAQSKDYVAVLERINAVGMAVQVLSNISEENTAARDKSVAELSKQLLSMYGSPPSPARVARRTAAKSD